MCRKEENYTRILIGHITFKEGRLNTKDLRPLTPAIEVDKGLVLGKGEPQENQGELPLPGYRSPPLAYSVPAQHKQWKASC